MVWEYTTYDFQTNPRPVLCIKYLDPIMQKHRVTINDDLKRKKTPKPKISNNPKDVDRKVVF